MERTPTFPAACAPTPAVGGLALPLGPTALLVAVLAPLVLAPELCTLVHLALLAVLVAGRGLPVARALTQRTTPLVVLVLLGLLVDWGGVPWRFLLQDLWRATKPVLLLVLGFRALRGREAALPRLLVLAGLLYGALYLARLGQECVARGVAPFALSEVVVHSHLPEALALGVLLRHRGAATGPGLSGWLLARAAVVVCVAALALSGSRTWVLAAAVLLLAGSGWLRGSGRWRALLIALPFVAATALTPFGELAFEKGFAVALGEVSPARYVELSDIHENWRGYEAWRGLEAVRAGDPLQLALGRGFGAQADLGLHMELGGTVFREIGQFHNGYVWLLLKVGWVGLAVYLLWLLRLVGGARQLARLGRRAEGDLVLGLAVVLALATLVVSGPFNPAACDAGLLALGGYLALLASSARRASTTPSQA